MPQILHRMFAQAVGEKCAHILHLRSTFIYPQLWKTNQTKVGGKWKLDDKQVLQWMEELVRQIGCRGRTFRRIPPKAVHTAKLAYNVKKITPFVTQMP